MTRLRIAMVAGFVLLGAQVAAGWARLPSGMIAPLAGIAVLHILLTRHRGVWREPVRLGGVVAINLAVAAILYVAGTGLAALAGPLPVGAIGVTLAAAAACAVAALAWTPNRDAALDAVLSDADP